MLVCPMSHPSDGYSYITVTILLAPSLPVAPWDDPGH